MASSEVVEKLNQLWSILNDGVDSDIREKWWKIIVEKRSEPRRKFHNLTNVGRMLIRLEECEKHIKSAKAVSYAIFFHHLEYDPKATDNEEKSLTHFTDFCSDAKIDKDSPLVKEVTELILSTNSTLTDEHLSPQIFGDTDKHYFMDIDVSYMAAKKEEYTVYCAAIRDEYSEMDEKSYSALRLKVLKSLLKMPKIFVTQMFNEKYESEARSNIEAEINRIEEQCKGQK